MYIEPRQLKLYAGMALRLAIVITLMVIATEALSPRPMPPLQSMQFLTLLMFWPGAFSIGFAFIAALAPVYSPPDRDDRRRGPDDDPPPTPPSPSGRPCRRREGSRRTAAVAVPLRV